MTTSPRVQAATGTTMVFLLALVSIWTSSGDLDATPLLIVLLVAAVVRLFSAAHNTPPLAEGDNDDNQLGNSLRAALVVIGFIVFLVFPQALAEATDTVEPATLGLGGLYGFTVLFITRRSRSVSMVGLALAATILSIMVGANPWWLVPLAFACAFAATGSAAERQLRTIGAVRPRSTRTNIAKGLAFAFLAALLAIWLRPEPPTGTTTEPAEPGEIPTQPPPPPTEPDLSWLLWLLLILIVLLLALLLWWYLRRRSRPWPNRALQRFTKAGSRLGNPLAANDTLSQFASRFPPSVGDLPHRVGSALDSTTYSQPNLDDVERATEPELQSLERLAKTEQKANRINRIQQLLRRDTTHTKR